jgi:hypothetical protein
MAHLKGSFKIVDPQMKKVSRILKFIIHSYKLDIADFLKWKKNGWKLINAVKTIILAE